MFSFVLHFFFDAERSHGGMKMKFCKSKQLNSCKPRAFPPFRLPFPSPCWSTTCGAFSILISSYYELSVLTIKVDFIFPSNRLERRMMWMSEGGRIKSSLENILKVLKILSGKKICSEVFNEQFFLLNFHRFSTLVKLNGQ